MRTGSSGFRGASASESGEFDATVLPPSRFGVAEIGRPLFPKTDESELVGVRTECFDEVVVNGPRTPLAQGEVVLVGAAFVTVPFLLDVSLRMLFDPLEVAVQRFGELRLDVALVETEVHGAQVCNRC